MEWLFGKHANAAVDTECGLLRKQNESVRTVLTKGRIPTLPPVVSVFAVPLHKLMKGSVTTGNQKSNCMEFDILIDTEDSFVVCDRNNKNNRVFVIRSMVPAILPPPLAHIRSERWNVEGKSFFLKEHAIECAKEFLKMKDAEYTQGKTKELKELREKIRFLSYIVSLMQEDPDLSKNYVTALVEIKKYIEQIINGDR